MANPWLSDRHEDAELLPVQLARLTFIDFVEVILPAFPVESGEFWHALSYAGWYWEAARNLARLHGKAPLEVHRAAFLAARGVEVPEQAAERVLEELGNPEQVFQAMQLLHEWLRLLSENSGTPPTPCFLAKLGSTLRELLEERWAR